MSIEALVDPAPAVLCAAAARPDVTSAMNEAHAALADLRFSEGLRRGWEEARAEAAVREAAALSIIEGARTSVDDVRALSMADDGGAASDPGAALALGIWRSQWNLASRFPALNTRSQGGARVAPTPLPALIAGLHRDACSGLVAAGLVESRTVAVPTDPALLAPALAYTRCDAPGLAVAAALTARRVCAGRLRRARSGARGTRTRRVGERRRGRPGPVDHPLLRGGRLRRPGGARCCPPRAGGPPLLGLFLSGAGARRLPRPRRRRR